jgi:hypothetical protein
MDYHDSGAHSNAPRSNRFLRPDELAVRGSRRRGAGHYRGPIELFAEGQWRVIRAQLELEGWSLSQIEMLYDQLRQGWPLAHAKQNVAVLTGRCPLHGALQTWEPPS